jgi:spermidine synthase
VLPEASIDAVEIDPAVVRVAYKYFDFVPLPTTRVFEEDGRVFAKRMGKLRARYDLVMLDAFDHEYIPEHLLTREFLQEIKGLLSEHGVLAANTFTRSRLYDFESATYHSVFGQFYRLKRDNRVILVRADGLPGRDELGRNAESVEARLAALGATKDSLLPLFGIESGWPRGTRILTDQYSPSNLLNGTF